MLYTAARELLTTQEIQARTVMRRGHPLTGRFAPFIRRWYSVGQRVRAFAFISVLQASGVVALPLRADSASGIARVPW
jgi:hypothetical protein